VAFAPRDNPKIAIAVIVEKSGQGATWAAPIASFIIEKYLTGKISKRSSGIYPEYYMNANLLPPPVLSAADKKQLRLDSVKKAQADSISKLKLKAASNKLPQKEPISKPSAMLPKRKEDELQ
jgi:penicillin-binding protein 2